jgi:hypothetical protein
MPKLLEKLEIAISKLAAEKMHESTRLFLRTLVRERGELELAQPRFVSTPHFPNGKRLCLRVVE